MALLWLAGTRGGELCRPCSTLATLHWLHHSRPTLTLGPSSAWAPSQHLTLTKHFSPMNGDYHHIYHGSRVTGQRQQISWVWCYHRLHICLAKCHKAVCTNPASSYKGWKVKLTRLCTVKLLIIIFGHWSQQPINFSQQFIGKYFEL